MASSPYDTGTLTKDLIELMDALHIDRADLIGWSLGGNEITAAAADYPERVGRIVYFDSYDGTDAADLYRLRPKGVRLPDAALTSLDAYCDYMAGVHYQGVERSRFEVGLRENLIVRGDGGVSLRMPTEVTEAQERTWLTERRPYARVHVPALAIFAGSLPDLSTSDPDEGRAYVAARQRLQAVSIARLEHELTGARTMIVPGTHRSFWLESRSIVTAAVREHLLTDRA